MPPGQIPAVFPSVNVNNVELPCYMWEVHVGSYGTLGTAHLYTSGRMLKESGIQLVNSVEGNATVIPVNISIVDQTGIRNVVFAGGYDRFEPIMHRDQVVIYARDMAAPMYDSPIVFSDTQYQNITPSDFAIQMAQKFGLSYDVDPTPNGTTIGATFNNQTVFMARPQSPWALLESLAQQIGFSLSVQPVATGLTSSGGYVQGVLKFKQIGKSVALPGLPAVPPTTFTWRAAPSTTPDNVIPIKELHLIHQPRKNKTFAVKVVSQDPNTLQPVVATAYAGAISTTQNVTAGVPVYLYNIPGRTYAQAVNDANGYAADIAKRELLATVTVDGMSSLMPLDQIVIAEAVQGDLFGLANRNMYVNSITHHFGMAPGLSSDAEGFLTTFTAMTVPQGITAAA